MNPHKAWSALNRYFDAHQPTGRKLEQFHSVSWRVQQRCATASLKWRQPSTGRYERDSWGFMIRETD